jgi:hypothetical protein
MNNDKELIDISSLMKDVFDVIVNNSALNINKFTKVVRINLRKSKTIYLDLTNFIVWKKHFS